MMRYQIQDNFVWANYAGESKVVKYPREIPAYSIMREESVTTGMLFDELASRANVYGEGLENMAYKIPEANVAALVDYKFDVDKLKEVVIPI